MVVGWTLGRGKLGCGIRIGRSFHCHRVSSDWLQRVGILPGAGLRGRAGFEHTTLPEACAPGTACP